MQRPFCSFPGGWLGIGLGVLRLVAGIDATLRGVRLLALAGGHGTSPWLLAWAEIFLGSGIAVGILTPVFNTLAALFFLCSAIPCVSSQAFEFSIDAFAVIPLVSIPIALVFTGPGAYSLDARLFGPREIVITSGEDPAR